MLVDEEGTDKIVDEFAAAARFISPSFVCSITRVNIEIGPYNPFDRRMFDRTFRQY